MTIEFSQTGESELPAVLLLGDTAGVWNELLPLLEPWMRAIVPADASEAQSLVAELAIESYAVVGQGEGGLAGQTLALEGPGEVKTLILLGSPELPGADLHTLDIPAFLLWGEDDEIVPIEVAERMSDALDFSTLALIPECGHDPLTEDGPTAVPLVYEFLRMRYLGKSHGHAETSADGAPIPIQILTHRPEPAS